MVVASETSLPKFEEEMIEEGMRAWYVLRKARSVPDYRVFSTEKVTPNSYYNEFSWWFPDSFLVPSNRKKGTLNFLGEVFDGSGKKLALDPKADSEMLDQLKQCTYLFLFHRELLSAVRLNHPIAVSTIFEDFLQLRKIFVLLKEAGITSLKELRPKFIVTFFERFRCGNRSHAEYVQIFEEIASMSRQGLIYNGIECSDYFIQKRTTVAKNDDEGAEPLAIEEIASVLDLSMTYVDAREEICRNISHLKESDSNKEDVLLWARGALPCGLKLRKQSLLNSLSSLILVPSFNLIGYHFGCRISELFSAEIGFVGLHKGENVVFTDRMTLRATTVKAVRKLYGHTRYFPAHPYINDVADALHRLKMAAATPGQHLFMSPIGGEVYDGGLFNERIQHFMDLHEMGTHITGHTWRKSMPGIIAEVLQNALPLLTELLGHDSEEVTARYAAASPWLHDAITVESQARFETVTKDLLADTLTLGGSGLGGAGRDTIEHIAASVLAENNEKAGDDVLAVEAKQLYESGVVPIKVDDDTFCFKHSSARGLCTESSGDWMPDVQRCRPECKHRVLTPKAQVRLSLRIDNLEEQLNSEEMGTMEKMEWSMALMSEVNGFQELQSRLKRKLAENPHLGYWFE